MPRSVAFKCTYNDAGEGPLVGFAGTCTRDNIRRNIREGRVWCSHADCPCRVFYDGGMKGEKPEAPCYESLLFRRWQYGAGYFHTGKKAGNPIHLRQTAVGRLAILTTRFPCESESARRIIGMFQIGSIDEGNETLLSARPRGRVRLPLEECRQLHFWAYHTTSVDSASWQTGLFRYLDDGQVHRMLTDVRATSREEETREELDYLIEHLASGVDAPPASGCLRDLSVNRLTAVAVARKYGAGGEGQAHKSLKEWVAAHPESIGLRDVDAAEMEHVFICGDSADIVFSHNDGGFTVVEIETTTALPGAHQAIKYRALLSAERCLPLNSPRIRAVLVAWSIPDAAGAFCAEYGIEARQFRLRD